MIIRVKVMLDKRQLNLNIEHVTKRIYVNYELVI